MIRYCDSELLWWCHMAAARPSIAGLMTIVGVRALDCAFLVSLWDRELGTNFVILVGVLPIVNGVGIAMLLMLWPRERR